MKRIAVASDQQKVAEHLRHCETFVLYDIEDNKIIHQEFLENPKNHEHGQVPLLLKQHGVHEVITNGYGPHAKHRLEQLQIVLHKGIQGDITKVIDDYLHQRLVEADAMCQHDHHEHHHHHG